MSQRNLLLPSSGMWWKHGSQKPFPHTRTVISICSAVRTSKFPYRILQKSAPYCESSTWTPTLHSMNRASWYTYVRKTNKMHTFLNNLFHLIYSRHVSSSGGFKQLTVFHHASYEESSCWHDTNDISAITNDTVSFVTCQRLDSS